MDAWMGLMSTCIHFCMSSYVFVYISIHERVIKPLTEMCRMCSGLALTI